MSLDGRQGIESGQGRLTISVVVPVYNRATILPTTIASILSQSRLPDQVVFCDDGSEDNSIEVIHQSFSSCDVPYTVVEVPNGGPSNARKVAVEHANGDWFFFLDSDDRWQSGYLEATEKLILRHAPEAVVSNFRKVFTKSSAETPGPEKFSEAPEGFWESGFRKHEGLFIATGPALFERTLGFQPCFPSALACSREAYERVGGITLKSTSLKSEDSHFTRKLYFHCRVAFQAEVQVHIVIHGGNRSMSGDRVLHAEKLVGKGEILKLMLSDPSIGGTSGQPLTEAIQSNLVDLFNTYYWAEDYANALGTYREMGARQRSPKLMLKKLICQLRVRRGERQE